MENEIKRGPGRPPIRQEALRQEEVREEPVKVKKVRARKGGANQDQLHVPREMIPEGMDYQWVTDSVLGKPEPHIRMSFEANGWEPVPADRHPGMFMPKGYKGEINVGGLVLMERPIELTMEARAEDQSAARMPRKIQENKMRNGDLDGVTLDTNHSSVRANTFVRSEMVPGIPIPD